MSAAVTDLFVTAHLCFLALAALGVLLADHSALQWMRGKEDPSHGKRIARVHWMVTAGLTGLVLTGLILFWPLREYLLTQPLFLTKLGFVLALVVNSFFVERYMHLPAHVPFASLTAGEKIPMFVSGAVSTFSWLGAASCAILIFRWPFV